MSAAATAATIINTSAAVYDESKITPSTPPPTPPPSPTINTAAAATISDSFNEKIKDLSPSEQEAIKKFWRSLVLRSQRAFSDENGGRLPQCANVRSCNCCPYGYHIDLDFVRYCEALANAKPSEEELRRRSRRRSRKSMEFMLGFESLFEQWDAAASERVHEAVPEMPNESDSPDSPRAAFAFANCSNLPYNSSTPANRPRSSSMPRFTYGSGLARSESPFGTASSTCSSMARGAESDVPYSLRKPANSPPETKAFLHDALDEVCSDFERTLERASMKRRKGAAASNGVGPAAASDRNNNNTDKKNGYIWHGYDAMDSCVSLNKSPKSYNRSNTLPFLRKPSPAEEQYESYVKATVAANSKSPVEVLENPLKITPPPPPPRRHAKLTSSTLSSPTECAQSPLSERAASLVSPGSAVLDAAAAAADAQTLFNIRQQMALSLKRMKDLEEQVKSIPELESELLQLRNDKQHLQQTLQRKDEELQKARDQARHSSSSSPVTSLKNGSSNQQFVAQRISPISLESMGSRLRSSSISSDKQMRSSQTLKRDVGTMCGLHATRDVGVGSTAPAQTQKTVGISPMQQFELHEQLYTQLQLEQHAARILKSHMEQKQREQLLHAKKLISVGTQMYVAKKDTRDNGNQTMAEKKVVKHAIGIMAKPALKENFVQCRPEVRSVGSSEHSIDDVLCQRCVLPKKSVACSTEDDNANTDDKKIKAINLKQMEMPPRSNTFSLGENEKLSIQRKSVGTQYTPIELCSSSSQTAQKLLHSIGIQNSSETASVGSQSQVATSHSQTDTRDLIRLCTTQISTEEYKPPPVQAAAAVVTKPAPAKPQTASTGCNTEPLSTSDNAVNTLPPASKCNSSSNTDAIHKRDIGCGDIVKPHISIACADNYCDSCKDAIKNLAKDFTKVPSATASPLPTRASESKIPRPKNLPSPSTSRRQFQRQNTYTLPSPAEEKKQMSSSLQEKPNHIAESSSGEEQSFISSNNNVLKVAAPQRSKTQPELLLSEKSSRDVKFQQDDLIVREQKRVSISWSREASPVPHQTSSLQSSFKTEEQLSSSPATSSPSKSLENSYEEAAQPAEVKCLLLSEAEPSKGARRKTTATLLHNKSSQNVAAPADNKAKEKLLDEQRPPSKALLQKLAMVEAEPREKFQPAQQMLEALKTINASLLKKMHAKPLSSLSLKSAKNTIVQDWFRAAGNEQSNAHEVEDYLDCIEQMSIPLLEYCVNLMDSNGNTAMHYAVSHGNFDVVSVLLDSKVCNVNQMNNAGYTSVMLVSLAKLKNAAHRTVVERLFQMADVNIRAKKHCQTALMLAVSHGNLDMVQMLIAAGADVNIQDEDGSTALMCAAEHGRIDIVKYVLSHTECNSLLQDEDGSTAFKIAWQAGHRDLGLLLYVHEQMLRSKMPNRGEPTTPKLSPHLPKTPK